MPDSPGLTPLSTEQQRCAIESVAVNSAAVVSFVNALNASGYCIARCFVERRSGKDRRQGAKDRRNFLIRQHRNDGTQSRVAGRRSRTSDRRRGDV